MVAPSLPASGLELCSPRHSNFALDSTGTDSTEARCNTCIKTDTYERAGGPKLAATLVILTTKAAGQGRAARPCAWLQVFIRTVFFFSPFESRMFGTTKRYVELPHSLTASTLACILAVRRGSRQ